MKKTVSALVIVASFALSTSSQSFAFSNQMLEDFFFPTGQTQTTDPNQSDKHEALKDVLERFAPPLIIMFVGNQIMGASNKHLPIWNERISLSEVGAGLFYVGALMLASEIQSSLPDLAWFFTAPAIFVAAGLVPSSMRPSGVSSALAKNVLASVGAHQIGRAIAKRTDQSLRDQPLSPHDKDLKVKRNTIQIEALWTAMMYGIARYGNFLLQDELVPRMLTMLAYEVRFLFGSKLKQHFNSTDLPAEIMAADLAAGLIAIFEGLAISTCVHEGFGSELAQAGFLTLSLELANQLKETLGCPELLTTLALATSTHACAQVVDPRNVEQTVLWHRIKFTSALPLALTLASGIKSAIHVYWIDRRSELERPSSPLQ